MRRRTNTHCQSSDEPKEIDRFKKRQPPRILFAEEVNYSMSINPLEVLETSSNNSASEGSEKSSSSKEKDTEEVPFQFVQESYTMDESKICENETKNIEKITELELKESPNTENILKEKEPNEKEPLPKKEIVIIGETILYEEKTKGFKKGSRRRYSHKNSDYMTY